MSKSSAFRKIILCIVTCMLAVNPIFVSASETTSDSDAISSATEYKKVVLTKAEQEYIAEHPTITIVADSSWRPLEYIDETTGELAGVIPILLKKLEYYTGFHIEYQIEDSYMEALEAVQSGEADMITGLAYDPGMAIEYDVNLTTPYLAINSAVISKNGVRNLYGDSSTKKIAVIAGDYANDYIKEEIPNSELVECSSNEECLSKVIAKEVDMAILAAYCTEYYMGVPKYSTLESHTISDFSWQLSFGINRHVNPHMISIMNKGIKKLSDWDINEAVYEGVISAAYDNDFVQFVYKHPFVVIGGILFIVLVIGILVFTIIMIRRQQNKQQVEDAVRLRLALERTSLCIWELDLKTRAITKIDNEMERHGFYDLRESIPESAIQAGYVHPEDVHIVKEVMDQVRAGKQDVTGCWRIRRLPDYGKETVYWWEQVLFHVVYDKHHKPVRVIGVSEDITREKIAERDSLTSVYNRKSFEQKASLVLNERRNAYLQCAFLILDLDGFKEINDTYGHAVGDQVLMSVGTALTKTFRSTDLVGRLGGDEFVVFMTAINKKEDVEVKAKELVENISRLQKKENFAFPISCSLGVVITEKGKDDFTTLYKKADTALYEAKHAGKNQFKIYSNGASTML